MVVVPTRGRGGRDALLLLFGFGGVGCWREIPFNSISNIGAPHREQREQRHVA